jgi:hypothetical protein
MRAPEDGCKTRPRQVFTLVDGATDAQLLQLSRRKGSDRVYHSFVFVRLFFLIICWIIFFNSSFLFFIYQSYLLDLY